jgi:hypothetical protein
MANAEWNELDVLTARIGELRCRRETTPKGRVGWLREIDCQILRVEHQREMLLAYLTRQLAHRIAA